LIQRRFGDSRRSLKFTTHEPAESQQLVNQTVCQGRKVK